MTYFCVLACLLALNASAVKRTRAGGAVADVWFDASEHLGIVNTIVTSFSGHRRLDVLELFGGVGAITKAAMRDEFVAASFDMATGGRAHDITTRDGFTTALNKVLSIKPRGLLVGGPPCSWWVWVSASQHKRTNANPSGDTSNPNVRMANIIVINTIVLFCVAMARVVWGLIEQPGTSMMRAFPCFSLFVNATMSTVFTWMGCFGHRLPKPSRLWSNLPTLSRLCRKWTPATRAAHRRAFPATKRRAWTEDTWVRGVPIELAKTAAYTPRFARAVLTAWKLAPTTCAADCRALWTRSGF